MVYFTESSSHTYDIIEKKRLVIEFADNEEKAKTHMADDGQSYYLDDYTLEEMFNEMNKRN